MAISTSDQLVFFSCLVYQLLVDSQFLVVSGDSMAEISEKEEIVPEEPGEHPTDEDKLLIRNDRAIVKSNEDTNPTTSSEKSREKKATEKCAYFWNFIFYVFCFLAGQYINFEIIRKPSSDSQPEATPSQPEATPSSDSRPEYSTWKKFISVVALIPFAGQVIVYIGYVATAFIVEGLTIANTSSTVMALTDNVSINCTLPQEHWKFTTAVTISAIAAIFSYGLMTVFILIIANVIRCGTSENDRCCIAYMKALRDGALSPYNDDDDESSKLLPEQTCYFFTNYVVVLVLFFFSAVSSVYYATIYTVYERDYCWMYLAMIVLQLISHFCAIQSCFIFSKIVYKVSNRLNKLAKDIDDAVTKAKSNLCQHNPPQPPGQTQRSSSPDSTPAQNPKCAVPCLVYKEEVDRNNYHALQKIDQEFVRQAKPMLKLFGLWFIFHWTLYALTTVLLSAFIIEIIIETIKYNFKSINRFLPNGEVDTKEPYVLSYVLYVVFFTLVHAYLFLYPCFRAAAIATARAIKINNISEKKWQNIPLSVQTSFVEYLKSQNFAFRVPLFCADIPIEFNWVFVSFLVPILGVYLAL